MRITDHIDLFYPDPAARSRAEERRKKLRASGAMYTEDLKLDDIKRLITLGGSERFMALAEELSDDPVTIEYRLDCLEDFLRNPELSRSFRDIIAGLSGRRPGPDVDGDRVESFLDMRNKMDELTFFLNSVREIERLYGRLKNSIRSEAVKGLFGFFISLPASREFETVSRNLTELREIFSKTIRSVKIGVNFDGFMTPDSAGILEVSGERIRPRGNVLERVVFGSPEGRETFSGEEHLNSLTRRTPVDIDTALFRELSDYTHEYARRVTAALRGWRMSFFTDITDLEEQLDYYGGAAAFIQSVRARGLPMCRPVILPAGERRTKLTGVFDLSFYKQLLGEDARARLGDRIVTNDLELGEGERFDMVTGANNGGKTTFARAVGVCQVLAQCGLFVPAESAEMSLCDNIFTHFPRDERLGIDTSRFTSEIKDLSRIARRMTDKSLVILNESLQSTTPEECLAIALIHLELMAAAGVRGLYVTHLTGLYKSLARLNNKGYPTRLGSLVSVAGEDETRLYKLLPREPSEESLAMSVYRRFGATLDDVIRRRDHGQAG